MAQISQDTSFAHPPNLQSRRQEHPKPNKSLNRHLNLEQASILLDTTSCPRGTGQGDAKAQSVLHSKVKPPLKPRTHLITPDPLLETAQPSSQSVQTHLIEPAVSSWAKDLSCGLFHGDSFLVKRTSPVTEGFTVSFGPQPPRALGATHLFSFPDLCAREEENTGSKEQHCVPWTIHFGKEEPGSSHFLSAF